MKKMLIALVGVFVLGFSGNAWAQDQENKDKFVRFNVLALDTYSMDNPGFIPGYHEGGWVLNFEVGKGQKLTRVLTFHIGGPKNSQVKDEARGWFMNSFGVGSRLEVGPRFLRLGGGVQVSRNQIYYVTRADKGESYFSRVGRDTVLVPYGSVTVIVGDKDAGMFFQYRNGPVKSLSGQGKATSRYGSIGMGFQLNY